MTDDSSKDAKANGRKSASGKAASRRETGKPTSPVENSGPSQTLSSADRPKPVEGKAVLHRDVESGTSTPPPAAGGEVKPIDSTLVGGQGAIPPAKPRSQADFEIDDQNSVTPVARAPENLAHERPSEPPVERVVVKKAGFVAATLGGVAAAAIGAGAMYFAGPYFLDLLGEGRTTTSVQTPDPAPVDMDLLLREARDAGAAAGQSAAMKIVRNAPVAPAVSPEMDARLSALETQLPESAERLSALETQLPESAERLSALEAKLSELQSAIPATPPTEALEDIAQENALPDALRQRLESLPEDAADKLSRLPGDIDTQLQSLSQRLADVPRNIAPQLSDITSQMTSLDERLNGVAQASDAVQDKLDALAKAREDQTSQLQTMAAETQSAINAATEQAQKRLEELQTQADEIRGEIVDAARAARQSAAVERLRAELIGKGDTAEALAELADSGVAPPEALSTDVPSLAELRASYIEAADAALLEGVRAEAAQSGGLGRVTGFLRTQTRARSIAPREGSDADAILSRATAALQNGNVTETLSELQSLPEPAQAEMAGWMTDARAYVAAQEALDQLATPSE